MGDNTGISWTDATVGFGYGCTMVSPGCTNCYALEVVAGLVRKFSTKPEHKKSHDYYKDLIRNTPSGPQWSGVVKMHPEHLTQPLRWEKPRRIFVNSLSDVFHDGYTVDNIADVFAHMAVAHWHTFQVLTKRPERMADLLVNPAFREKVELGAGIINASHRWRNNPKMGKAHPGIKWPLGNVWLGTSVENQKEADIRIPWLLKTPAKVRFLSMEPLLGPVDLTNAFRLYDGNGEPSIPRRDHNGNPMISWVIVGGESGKNFRPMKMEWVRSIQAECYEADCAFFFKQDAALKSGTRPHVIAENGSTEEIKQFPV